MQSACSSKIIVLTLLPMIDTFGDRCGLCGEACTPHSGHALLDSAGLGGLGRKVWPHSPAVATVSCGSAAPEEYPARAADSESHLQLVKCFLLHSRWVTFKTSSYDNCRTCRSTLIIAATFGSSQCAAKTLNNQRSFPLGIFKGKACLVFPSLMLHEIPLCSCEYSKMPRQKHCLQSKVVEESEARLNLAGPLSRDLLTSGVENLASQPSLPRGGLADLRTQMSMTSEDTLMSPLKTAGMHSRQQVISCSFPCKASISNFFQVARWKKALHLLVANPTSVCKHKAL